MSRADILAKQAIDNGSLQVFPETGEIYRHAGTERAEILDKRTGYGRVQVYARPYTLAMAHRIIWIAVFGHIPDGLFVNHINHRPWDNRIANLELVTPAGNVYHRDGQPYDAIGMQPDAINPIWLGRLDKGEARAEVRHSIIKAK